MEAYQPRALVVLEGANDAARDTLVAFERKLREWLGQLRGNVTAGKVRELDKFVWITAPTRFYKASGWCCMRE